MCYQEDVNSTMAMCEHLINVNVSWVHRPYEKGEEYLQITTGKINA